MIVVPVLMNSCQVLEKWNRGSVAAERRTSRRQITKVVSLPIASEILVLAVTKNFSLVDIPNGSRARKE